jgi:hypothetical protein
VLEFTYIFSFSGKHKEIFDVFKNSSLRFHPTGSRYFGTATPFSDWDFFTQESHEARDFLVKQGFWLLQKDADNTSYGYLGITNNPLNIGEVWENNYFSNPSVKVHVQLVSDYELKKVVHVQLIKRYGIYWGEIIRDWDKQTRRDFWNLLMNVAQASRTMQAEQKQEFAKEKPVVTESQKDELLNSLPHSGIDNSMMDFVADLID